MAEVNTNNLLALPKGIANFVSDIVGACHKEAAFAMGILSGLGIMPASNHFTTSVLLGYSVLAKVAESLRSAPAPVAPAKAPASDL